MDTATIETPAIAPDQEPGPGAPSPAGPRPRGEKRQRRAAQEPFERFGCAQRTAEWLEWRRSGIGASEAGVIAFHLCERFGATHRPPPWLSSIEELFREKVTGENRRFETAAMRRGIELEDSARQWVERQLGLTLEPMQARSRKHPHLLASADGLGTLEGRRIAIEIKCPAEGGNSQDWADVRDGRVPDKYVPQVQHQMLVLQPDDLYFVVFDGMEGVMVQAAPDPEFAREYLSAAGEFWASVREGKEPPAPFYDIEDPEQLVRAARVAESYREFKRWEAQYNEAKAELVARTPGRRARFGQILTLTRYPQKGKVDMDLVGANLRAGVSLEDFRKAPSEACRVTVLDPGPAPAGAPDDAGVSFG